MQIWRVGSSYVVHVSVQEHGALNSKKHHMDCMRNLAPVDIDHMNLHVHGRELQCLVFTKKNRELAVQLDEI